MRTPIKFAIATLVFTIVGFTLNGQGPIGGILWPPADGPAPEGTNLALLMVMAVIEAVSFGVGVAFLIFGWTWIKGLNPATKNAATLAYVGIAWSLINWVPHTALHMSHGNILTPDDFTGLVAIEYGFHATLIVAALLVMNWFVRALMARAMVPAEKPMATPKATRA